MSVETILPELATLDPRRQDAIRELVHDIQDHFPVTSFQLRSGVDDPHATWLVVTVEIDDPDDVIDLVIDRLLAWQVEESLPIYVLPVHSPERTTSIQQSIRQRTPEDGESRPIQV